MLSAACEAEEGWDSFFHESTSPPLRLWYEDVVSNLETALAGILEWIGVHQPAEADLGRLRHQPQATDLNAEWEARFRDARPGA
jgi:LPS sulfotransferase NodH